MPVVKYTEMPVAKMSANVDRREAHTENLMLTVIDLRGQGSQVPVHAHPHEQISYIAEGRVRFVVGDVVVAPPNTPHGAEVLSDSARVIDAFHPIREDFL
jgi:quercetin dioxygenase-like cupin family protein